MQPNELIFNTKNPEKYQSISVYDFSGKLIHQSAFPKNQKIDVSTWKKGIYLLQFQTKNGEVSTKKLIKK